MKKLVFATNNQHKLIEIREALKGKFDISSLKEINFNGEIPETQETLQGNASQKSHYIHDKFEVNCFADDTGLEIDSLDGRPGVYSARYAGDDCNPEKNMAKVLEEMRGKINRTARFKTVISLILDNKEYFFEGVAEGKILTTKQGEKGFGYDPVFQPAGYDRSFAQMGLDEKNEISHRGKAIKKLVAFLDKY